MTTFLLIRHATHTLGGGVIAGRSPEAKLSPLGQQQASALAQRLASLPIAAVYCSPVQRAMETAAAICDRLKTERRISEALAEIEFGQWNGRKIDDLEPDAQWRQWNAFRSGNPIPGGEWMVQVQARIVNEMLKLRQKHPGEVVALVSHGDVIKSALAYFMGVAIDLMPRIEISLASVSVVAIAEGGPWVLCVNNTGEIKLGAD